MLCMKMTELHRPKELGRSWEYLEYLEYLRPSQITLWGAGKSSRIVFGTHLSLPFFPWKKTHNSRNPETRKAWRISWHERRDGTRRKGQASTCFCRSDPKRISCFRGVRGVWHVFLDFFQIQSTTIERSNSLHPPDIWHVSGWNQKAKAFTIIRSAGGKAAGTTLPQKRAWKVSRTTPSRWWEVNRPSLSKKSASMLKTSLSLSIPKGFCWKHWSPSSSVLMITKLWVYSSSSSIPRTVKFLRTIVASTSAPPKITRKMPVSHSSVMACNLSASVHSQDRSAGLRESPRPSIKAWKLVSAASKPPLDQSPKLIVIGGNWWDPKRAWGFLNQNDPHQTLLGSRL